MQKVRIDVDYVFMPHNNSGTYGIANSKIAFSKSIVQIFTKEDSDKLKNEASKNSDGASLMHSFCQFVVYVKMKQDLTGQAIYFDCEDNIDYALDLYNRFTKHDYGRDFKQEFMEEFMGIRADYERLKNTAELFELPPLEVV